MAEDDQKPVDPRYDPAFQRGYAGEVRMAQRGESALRRTAAGPSAPVRAGASDVVPSSGARAHDASTATHDGEGHAGSLSSAHPDADATVESVLGTEPASARDLTRNPFYLAAAALAVLLIVGGAVWLNQGFAAIADDRTSTTVGYYAAMAMSFGAPLTIGIGVAIIAGLLFVLARGWRPHDGEA